MKLFLSYRDIKELLVFGYHRKQTWKKLEYAALISSFLYGRFRVNHFYSNIIKSIQQYCHDAMYHNIKLQWVNHYHMPRKSFYKKEPVGNIKFYNFYLNFHFYILTSKMFRFIYSKHLCIIAALIQCVNACLIYYYFTSLSHSNIDAKLIFI